MPTDDDAWFSPRLASVLATHLDDMRAGYHWPYRRYGRLYRRPMPRELVWCEPYVAMMRDLMAELRLR